MHETRHEQIPMVRCHVREVVQRVEVQAGVGLLLPRSRGVWTLLNVRLGNVVVERDQCRALHNVLVCAEDGHQHEDGLVTGRRDESLNLCVGVFSLEDPEPVKHILVLNAFLRKRGEAVLPLNGVLRVFVQVLDQRLKSEDVVPATGRRSVRGQLAPSLGGNGLVSRANRHNKVICRRLRATITLSIVWWQPIIDFFTFGFGGGSRSRTTKKGWTLKLGGLSGSLIETDA